MSSVRRNKATYRKRGEHRESNFSQQKRHGRRSDCYSHCNQPGIRKNGEESQNHRRTQTIRGRRKSKCQK
nr:MAG TPA: hypothetical protein [Caudoviricetes sp.]